MECVALTRHPHIELRLKTSKGRGVFATARIPERTTLDVSPVLVFDPTEYEEHVGKSKVWFYSFTWPLRPKGDAAADPSEAKGSSATKTVRQTQALPLGLGALFNHASLSSPAHNVGFLRDVENEVIRYVTLRPVEAGEELCISYGPKERLGFVDVHDGLDPKHTSDQEEQLNELERIAVDDDL